MAFSHVLGAGPSGSSINVVQDAPPPAGDKSTRKVSKLEQKGGKVMSKKSKRIAMILVGVVMALLAVAQHFGWIAGPPPILAPGIR